MSTAAFAALSIVCVAAATALTLVEDAAIHHGCGWHYKESKCLEHADTCQWCPISGECFNKSFGSCCESYNACEGRDLTFCTKDKPLCLKVNVTVGPMNCSVAGCCPKDKPKPCASGNSNTLTCMDPATEKCCKQSAVPAPKDAECCFDQDVTDGKAWCAKGKFCCVNSTGNNIGTRHTAICCDKATESCHLSKWGNFCAKKNQTEPCNDNLDPKTCLSDARCQLCGGKCMKLSAGKCCQPKGECTKYSFGQICPSNTTCGVMKDTGNCTEAMCCPLDKPSFCGRAGCYDASAQQCCTPENGRDGFLAPLGSVCCATGACPSGSWCCGFTTLACCNSTYSVCDNNHFQNRCLKP